MEKKERRRRRRNYTRQFYRGNKLAFILTLVQTLVLVAGNLMIAWLLQVILDAGTGTEVGYTIWQLVGLCGLCIGVWVVGLGLYYLARPRFKAKAMGQYTQYIFEKISQKGISAFSGENTSFYISALSNDANAIESGYINNLFELISDSVQFVSAFALMIWYSPVLTAVGMGLSLLPIVASLLAGDRVAKAEEVLSEKNNAYMSTLSDCLSGFSVVKSFKAERAMCRLFGQKIKEVTKAKTVRGQMAIVVQAMALITGCIAQLGVFLVGAAMALNGQHISGGTLILFVQLMNYVVNPIGTIPQYLAQRKAACALMDKVADALEENVREKGMLEKEQLERGIAVQNLSFGYEAEKPVLQGVDFFFEKGKSYAIVGASGSGKSTLLNLLMAAHPGYEGRICYDDTELRQISSESLYEMVSVIQQNVFIFNASIRDNITMFSDFPAEEVERAIRLSGLSALVRQKGENYLCGENGSGLSGGEKQRISIARSLLKRSQVLLVDEATAALDAQTAFQVSDAILGLEDLTRLVVTHSLDGSLLRRYDCVLTLKNGRLCECGSFHQLMEQKGYFYSLYTVSQ